MTEIATVWFANDTPLQEGSDWLSVVASALSLPAGYWPDQIIVNGYSHSSVGGCGPMQLYKRDHDGAFLGVYEAECLEVRT